MELKMTYWRLKVKGELSADELQSVVGMSGGTIVRVHSEGGETDVYFVAEEVAASQVVKSMKDSITLEEVRSEEVTKIS